MDSFSTPDVRNSDGIAPSPANFIAPGKRPMSSQSPTVVLNQDGSVRLVIGASGSSKMMTSISMVRKLFMIFDSWVKKQPKSKEQKQTAANNNNLVSQKPVITKYLSNHH